MDYIEEARNIQKASNDPIVRYGWFWGEMDWIEELHRLLYEFD